MVHLTDAELMGPRAGCRAPVEASTPRLLHQYPSLQNYTISEYQQPYNPTNSIWLLSRSLRLDCTSRNTPHNLVPQLLRDSARRSIGSTTTSRFCLMRHR
ncbi:hypothetical protein HBI56_207270 [Parastagonospora nodorum]|nr:hypothetical protein HBH52_230440 [Parastagonospora nodorum]KAH3992019.1 hypothetical protein HBI10_224320 [Parastagonospora nodorum]KAH4009797.1 hypothetical protein HBI13_215120 [Parastagonospora nodorum]KAH4016790.1 hypothetical protein HBI09_200090 [Parastagonospora nodorum]KAH4043640.1 hypothetical protein HBH49_229300 [Parastagonospora nodorum]